MSVKSSRDEPFIPKDSTIPVSKKQKELNLKKTQASHINALTTKITETAQTESSKNPIKLKRTKKSTKEERERKSFDERAKDLGFKFNNENNTYQSIKEPGKQITIEEMVDLIKENEALVKKIETIESTAEPILVPDVVLQVLSFVDSKDINSARLVNKSWNSAAPSGAIKHEMALLKPYLKVLNLYSEEFERDIVTSKNLTELQTRLLELREKIVMNLKEHSDSNLERMKISCDKLKPPLFFDKLFDLIPIYKDIDEYKAARMKHWGCRDSFMINIFDSLCHLGCFEKSIEFANSIDYDYRLKRKLLYKECIFLAEAGKSDEAVKQAKELPDEKFKRRALKTIPISLVKVGKFNEAIKQAKKLPDELKDLTLKKVSICLCKAGEFYKATQLAHTIKNGGIKDGAFWGISKELCKVGKLDQAIVMTYSISIDDKVRDDARHDTSVALASVGRFDEALSLAAKIIHKDPRELALKTIAIEQTKAGRISEAFQTVKSISFKQETYRDISIELSKLGDFDLALKLAKQLDWDVRIRACEGIAIAMANLGKFEEAIQVANTSGYYNGLHDFLRPIERLRRESGS